MIGFALYLLKVSICLAAFYVLYTLLFRQFTLHRINRFYLLTGLICSFLIPLAKFSLMGDHNYYALAYSIEDSFLPLEGDLDIVERITDVPVTVDYWLIVACLYFAGALLRLSRILFSVIKIVRSVKGRDAVGTYRTKVLQPFSFLTAIFLPSYEVDPMIVEHEVVHVRQMHWIDLMMAELATVVLWFNPVAFLYKRAIKIQHEYLADAQVIQGAETENYLACLLNQVQVESGLGPVSEFYSKSIKSRIMMITKEKTSRALVAAYLLVIPAVALLLAGFATRPLSGGSIQGRSGLMLQDHVPSITPVDRGKTTVSSGFGNRIDPITNKEKFHTGIDLRLSEGNLVFVTADGIVFESKTDSVRGNYIIVKHGDVYMTSYSHLKSRIVKAGEALTQGQTIGYVGSTGWSTAPHLHYEVLKDGKPVDPKDYFQKLE